MGMRPITARNFYLAFGIAVLLLGLAAAGWQVCLRWRQERAHTTVQLLLPYDELLLQTAQRGAGEFTLEQAVAAYARAGVGGLLLREQTLETLREKGELAYFSGTELLAAYRGGRATGWVGTLGDGGELRPGKLYLEVYEAPLFWHLLRHLEGQGITPVLHSHPGEGAPGSSTPGLLSFPGDAASFAEAGLGFPPLLLQGAQETGLELYLQLAGPLPGAGERAVSAYYGSLRELPRPAGLLFRDSSVPGLPGQAALFRAELAALGAPLVTIDLFERQRPALAAALRLLEEKKVFRLHALSQEEMHSLSPRRAVQRYTLAAAERNCRLLLLRFLHRGGTGAAWLEGNLAFTADLGASLKGAGLQLGAPAPYTPLPLSKVRLLLMGSGAIAAAALLTLLLGYPAAAKIGAAAAFLALLFLLAPGISLTGVDRLELARKGAALLAALVFPVLALALARPFFGRGAAGAFAAFLLAAAVSLAGALLLSGLLADLLYMAKLEQFAGVRPALALPPLLVWLLFSGREGQKPTCTLQEQLRRPLCFGSALGAVLLLAVYLLYLNRAGNEPFFISELELRLRLFLGDLLLARPRTKELFLGHPLLLLAAWYGRRLPFAPLLAAAGSVGQASLLNSFAHAHTPLFASLARTGLALALGAALGLALVALVQILATSFKLPLGQENSRGAPK